MGSQPAMASRARASRLASQAALPHKPPCLTSRRCRCPLTLQVVLTFNPTAKPDMKADGPDAYEERSKAERAQDRKKARGAVVDLDDIAAWPKSDC